MKIAIASGKGGTGKTLVALNLARSYPKSVTLLDCDVEEPNNDLFLKGKLTELKRHSVLVPKLKNELCDGCRICQQACQFNAIIVIAGKAMVFDDLCHNCGACTLLCPQKALYEVEHEIGTVTIRQKENVRLVEGRLDVGKALAVPLIRRVKSEISLDESPIIIDSPPGTSCPMVWTIGETDLVVLVAEPTAFGLHDLTLAVETVREVGIGVAVIINKDGLGDNRIEKYCEKEKIPILKKIGFNQKIATTYAIGEVLVDTDENYKKLFLDVWEKIEILVKGSRRHEQ
ncbi:MAG: ATP-binding protein [Sphaerochaetaceae bacterium]